MAPEHAWPNEFMAAGTLLAKAHTLSESLRRSQWDFAVEISELSKLGLTRTDLRWLVCKGFIDHADEVSLISTGARQFQATAKLKFTGDSCFILTALGRTAVVQLGEKGVHRPNAAQSPMTVCQSTSKCCCAAEPSELSAFRPSWNAGVNRLFLGKLLVKQYRRPAPNQQRILSAFQEEDWPERIDDPLPPAPGLEPRRRLQEAVAGLNRRQANPVLRFAGDGHGQGVTWTAALSLLDRGLKQAIDPCT
jgi:hypothetical protein